MPTTPTDLLARLRAVLTAAEAMTPPPVAWSRYRDGVFIGIFEGPTDPRTVHDPGPRFEFRPLVEAPAPLTDADLTMRVARAIFDARCPGIRWTDEDAPAYLAAAKAAIEGMEAPAPLTVGAALADPRVQDGSHVVEYRDGDCWEQERVCLDRGDRLRARYRNVTDRDDADGRWTSGWLPVGVMRMAAYALPCRLVPLTDADRNPNERGPL